MYAQILDGLGDRPLGLEADQPIEIARWIKGRAGVGKLRLKASGISSQVRPPLRRRMISTAWLPWPRPPR